MTVARHLKRFLGTGRAKDQPLSLHLALNRGLPSQYLSILLVRSYHTLAPLPVLTIASHRRYVSVALSAQSPVLGVTQRFWSFESPDFPQMQNIRNRRTYSPSSDFNKGFGISGENGI
ncbi:hypothetical protein GlitD10_1132 [Gloeomargarita lithophora Alchichica-D10]|uniref:Uncharacterized protein n=1 Tax=Gloeomargarita lithophora Alchichica-D10 TaxID=1188229 RepID=A0A1J0ABX5_9CYAN|nr:hypothetical protein GlitD10_1132 [Gloeomargarita lithophora Alchichica-D10]